MKAMIQARLDEETQAALERLVRQHGLKASEIVREGIRLVDKQYTPPARPRLIGVGMFSSGITDLSTNKKHMEGFGKKWRVDDQGNGRWDW
jgi:hypothetical protein